LKLFSKKGPISTLLATITQHRFVQVATKLRRFPGQTGEFGGIPAISNDFQQSPERPHSKHPKNGIANLCKSGISENAENQETQQAHIHQLLSFSQIIPAALTDFPVFLVTEFTIEAKVSQLFEATLMIPGFDLLKEGDRFKLPSSLLLNMLRRTR
jgi:hypothetical protein